MGGSKEEIAELCGAVMGDGWIEEREKGFFIAGDPIEDKDYYDNHLSKLLQNIFKINISPKQFPYWKVYGISFYKKKLIKQLLNFGLAKGKKVNSAYVPDWIFRYKSSKIPIAFIRGVFDTDGSVFCQKDYTKYANSFNSKYHSKIRIRIGSVSQKLICQLSNLCNRLGFRTVTRIIRGGFSHNRNRSNTYILEINEKRSIENWFKRLKPSNPKHNSKYLIWKQFNFCPPNTTLHQRKQILKNKLNPYNLYSRG